VSASSTTALPEESTMEPAATPRSVPRPELDRFEGSRRPTLVITDSGFEASLVAFDSAFKPKVGDRFWYAGQVWEVVGWRPEARTFIASLTGRAA
jgi:hypothetical protein